MQQPTAHVPAPEITVDETGTARSVAFDDVYFSARGGVAETEHVFLAGNGLPARWSDKKRFTIGELGFGTGLNFLVAWKRFRETNPNGTLHFVSVEKFPLTHVQLQQALAHQPELAHEAQALLAHYPLRLPGWHRVQCDGATLTLGFGDVSALLPQMDAEVDAWFLDGFAPAKNDAMWNAGVFEQIARLSAADATFATFTAAGAVKRGLTDVGFMVQKVQGFGHKRDMLVGKMIEGGLASPSRGLCPRTITIIGGGIAGCTAARALAERGAQVTLYEKETIASAASGNAAAVLYPQLTKHYTASAAWHFTGYGHSLRALARWKAQGFDFTMAQTGMLKIGKDDADDAKLRSIRDGLQLDETIARWVERDEASALLAQPVPRGGFWFPQGTWFAPAELCRALVVHPNITVREHHPIVSLKEIQADAIIVTNAFDANALVDAPLKFGRSAGQVSVLEPTLPLNAILCHKGYAIATSHALVTGATYDRDDLSGAVTEANHQQNMHDLQQVLPVDARILGGRTSIRTTTPTHLPYVGEVQPNVWVSVGHGSRGMISAPLAAEIIASQLFAEPLPVSRSLLQAVVPRSN